MGISEILIIYLAVGAPIGVYAIVRSKNLLTKNLIGILAANVLFWPVFASLEFVPKAVSGHGSKYFIDGGTNSATAFERSRSAFTSSVKDISDRNFRREALDGFDRFAALSDAVLTEASAADVSVPELFVIAGHPLPSLASKCLFRKNRRKLADHRDRAFADIAALAGKLTAPERTVYDSALAAARAELFDRAIS